MASGELRGSIGLTEPNAGSDLQAIRTVARRDGDDYVVNGTKTWITNSLHGHLARFAAGEDRPAGRAAPQGHEPADREKGPGFIGGQEDQEIGYRSHRHLRAVFEDYRVPSDLLGGVEGKGFIQTAGGLELGPHQRGRARRRHCRRRAALMRCAIRRSADLRQAHLPAPGGPAEAGRHGDPGRRRQAPDRAGGAQVRRRRTLRPRGRRWPSCRLEAGVENSLRGDAHLRRLQLFGGLRRRALLPRRAADVHRRRHERDPAHKICDRQAAIVCAARFQPALDGDRRGSSIRNSVCAGTVRNGSTRPSTAVPATASQGWVSQGITSISSRRGQHPAGEECPAAMAVDPGADGQRQHHHAEVAQPAGQPDLPGLCTERRCIQRQRHARQPVDRAHHQGQRQQAGQPRRRAGSADVGPSGGIAWLTRRSPGRRHPSPAPAGRRKQRPRWHAAPACCPRAGRNWQRPCAGPCG
jgi:hypothetical protein